MVEGEEMANSNSRSSSTSNNSASNSDYINMSEQDRIAVELLKVLMNANTISFMSDILSMQATINGINSIYNKYTENKINVYNPDERALYSIYIGIFSRLIVTGVGYRKYELAYKSLMNGDNTVNINNFIKINFANAVLLFGALIASGVAKNIYDNGRLNIFV